MATCHRRPRLKLLVVGESGVGKTSLIERYVNNTFVLHCQATVGEDIKRKTVEINGQVVDLIIWDSPGQTAYRNITVQSIRDSDAVIIVYDISRRQSFQTLPVWIQKIDMYAPNAQKILVGNKCEPDVIRQVTFAEARAFGEQLGLTLMEVSVKLPQHVDEMFDVITERVLQKKYGRGENNVAHTERQNGGIHVEEQPRPKSGCRC